MPNNGCWKDHTKEGNQFKDICLKIKVVQLTMLKLKGNHKLIIVNVEEIKHTKSA